MTAPRRIEANEPSSLSRRSILHLGAGLGAGLAVAGTGSGVARAAMGPAGFPTYRYVRDALDKRTLKYNPTGELIFPCIRGTEGRVANSLGRFYLYYAPHDAPGGICLAYADSLEGPFTEYPNNPIVKRVWSPHYSVTHVSSPHVVWNSRAKEMWLYFHGENTTTRLARSKDGITFVYDRVVLDAKMLPDGTTEASYARVFEHDLPDRDAHYVMLFMANDTTDHRSIGWGWSADGRTWTFARRPLVRAAEVGARNVSGPHLLKRSGSAYVVFHTNNGGMRIMEIGGDFSRRTHLGAFHVPLDGHPDYGRSAAPSFGSDGGVQYMFYEAGQRLEGTIAIARAT
ncbi:hypothetical protein [Nonomuraea lactucae]|uniref:hypothetical protein n=1 Tax=Nonomuraea lactucae TaxID=2249762 RepID=UPI000DE4C448|nr:hypothetical protein [Nonomuraea lactucae]